MKTPTLYTALFISIMKFTSLSAQDLLPLKNPSFEGIPKVGSQTGLLLNGWNDCGALGETIPDIHSASSDFFQVEMEPFDGETYLGMVTRDNDTREAIGQQLLSPLMEETEYLLTISLARSPNYINPSRTSYRRLFNFNTPAILRIWGGNKFCDRLALLAQTQPIEHEYWQEYNLFFTPQQTYQYLVLEVYYDPQSSFPTNGNILLDDLSIEIVPEK